MPLEFDKLATQGLNKLVGVFQSRDGYARPSRYEVEISVPADINLDKVNDKDRSIANFLQRSIIGGGSNATRKMSLRCDQVSFPGKNLRTTPTTAIDYGPQREIAQGAIFGEVTLSFYASSDHRERVLLENWQELIMNTDRSSTDQNKQSDLYDIEYYNNYIGQIDVFQLNELDERTYAVSIHEAYPKSINAIEFNHSNTNAITRISASFVFNRWSSETIETKYLDTALDVARDFGADTVTNLASSGLPNVLNL